jgi:hypothetical protein
VCDPDITLDIRSACNVILKALELADDGRIVLAYGRIRSEGGCLLRSLVAFDKDWSHRVVRPMLWRIGLGASVPGQFLVVSGSLLSAIDPSVDSYLDDLYLGLHARSAPETAIVSESLTVGFEASRCGWISLVAQRMRWMKGLAALAWHTRRSPSAAMRLATHFVAYHAFPIFALTSLAFACVFYPAYGLIVTVLFVAITSALAGQHPAVGLAYWITFPALQTLVIFTWWLPLPKPFLLRR